MMRSSRASSLRHRPSIIAVYLPCKARSRRSSTTTAASYLVVRRIGDQIAPRERVPRLNTSARSFRYRGRACAYRLQCDATAPRSITQCDVLRAMLDIAWMSRISGSGGVDNATIATLQPLFRPPPLPPSSLAKSGPSGFVDALAQQGTDRTRAAHARLRPAPPSRGSRRHAPRPAPAAPLPRSISGCAPSPIFSMIVLRLALTLRACAISTAFSRSSAAGIDTGGCRPPPAGSPATCMPT